MAKRTFGEEDLPKVKLNKTNVKSAARILKYLKPYMGKFVLGMIFLVLTAATALVFPMLLGKLINASGVGMNMSAATEAAKSLDKNAFLNNINQVGGIMLLVFIAQAVFSFFRIKLFVEVTERMLTRIRQVAYAQLIQQPMRFFANRRVGELNSRLAADISQLQDTFTTAVAELLRQFILIIGSIAFLAYTSVELSLVMLSIIPVLAVIAVVFGRYIRKTSKLVQDEVATSSTIVEETLQAIQSVKAFANEGYEITRYSNSTNKVLRLALRNGSYRGAFAAFIILGMFGGIVFVIWYASRMLANGDLDVGQMISFMFYTIYIGASFGGIAEMYAQLQKAVGSTERIMDIIDETIEPIQLNYSNVNQLKLQGNINFNNVAFAYPARPDFAVLKGMSFGITTGQKVAIVGQSGAGKSTIIQLLQRFYSPQSGEILFDGQNAESYDLTPFRNNIAIVPQDVLLFGGTILENIAYGKPGASMNEVVEAAKKANAHLFIDSFPEKYATLVGDRGIQLSGGQRQRIAIARAVLKNPSILLLDEATSSLDSESEKLVQDALEKLMEGRTSIIVAHRLSTIRNADKIIVIDQGQIAETGTHDELSNLPNGIYANLSRLQFEQRSIVA